MYCVELHKSLSALYLSYLFFIDKCEFDSVICEYMSKRVGWSDCPPGEMRKARAWFGREAGDNTTCVHNVPSSQWSLLQNLDCPGDEVKNSEKVNEQ